MMRAARRELPLDLALGVLVGLLSIGAARLSRFAADTMRTGHGFTPGGPAAHGMTGWPGFADTAGLSATFWPLLIGWAILLAVGVAGRRQYPRIAYLLTIVAGCGYLLSGFPFGPVMLAPALTLLAMARSLPTRRWIGWIGLLALFVWSGFVGQPAFGLTDLNFYQALIFGSGLMLLPALIGLIRRTRDEARRRTRELELRRSAFEERLRIARDVHDVVGHSLSVINMQAGVALHLLDRRPEQAETSLQAIKATSNNALDELRSTLAVFRTEDYAGDRSPVAGLDRLAELIGAFEAGGRRVEVIGADDLAARSAATDLAGYRIIQEALTNVARHSSDADSRVELRSEHDQLHIKISNGGPRVRLPIEHDGTGITGMSERASSVGGSLHAGPRPEGGFLVEAWLPAKRTVVVDSAPVAAAAVPG